MRSTRQPCWYAVALIDGEPAGAGLAIADDDLVGVFAMRTRPDEGLGAGSAVLGALVDEVDVAGDHGVAQVERRNDRATGTGASGSPGFRVIATESGEADSLASFSSRPLGVRP